MNKKNIILGLSLILSSVATLNLTSCSDDDDDDANHAPKSAVVDDAFSNKEIKDAAKSADSIKTQLGTDVKNYMVKLLAGQKYHLSVQEGANNISIKVVMLDGNRKNPILEKIDDNFCSKNSGLRQLVRKTWPNVEFDEYGSSSDTYFYVDLVKNFDLN